MDEHDIERHPDLMDPDWQRHAEKEAWVDLRRSRRTTKLRKRVTISAVVLVAVAAAGFAVYQGKRSPADPHATAPAPVAATTTTAPTDLPEDAHVDLSRPFDNTPAQNWAEGITGLTVPPATKIGSA